MLEPCLAAAFIIHCAIKDASTVAMANHDYVEAVTEAVTEVRNVQEMLAVTSRNGLHSSY